MDKVTKGDRYLWQGMIHIEVTRVSTEGDWADIKCWTVYEPERTWTKRADLPFPSSYKIAPDLKET